MKINIPKLERLKDFPLWAISQANTLYNKTGSWRNYRPVYNNKLPPCNHACPTGEKIQGHIDLLKNGKYRQAWQLIKEDNPMPAVCGRVCFHPCETACNRREYDEPIAVHNIERFIGDFGLAKRLKACTERSECVKRATKRQSKTIAIIGGGPAGLSCAYHLTHIGYKPTIFEASNKLGGMLMWGIPGYRLPKDILKKEIDSIIKSGVKVTKNTRIGVDISFEELQEQYEAVFIATGAHKERKLNILGESHPGVIPALDLLHALNQKRRPRLGKRVAIIGGGNAAIDAARSVLRMGKSPTIIYRRTRNEMPAIPDEIKDAEEEGIKFVFLAAPVRIITRGKKISQLECIKMKLGTPDKSGRRRPIPIKRSNFCIKVNNIIPAIGEEPDLSFLNSNAIVNDNLIDTDSWGATNLRGVFAGGDAVTGPKTVVEALGAGKRAARAIHQYFTKLMSPLKEPEELPEPVSFSHLNLTYFEPADRVTAPKLTLKERARKIKEVYQTYKTESVLQEAERCFSCGVCNRCDNCFVFCPDVAVIKKDGRAANNGDKFYEFNYDYCKGCGICVTECPRNVISLEEEKR